jgi:hypothetical protein
MTPPLNRASALHRLQAGNSNRFAVQSSMANSLPISLNLFEIENILRGFAGFFVKYPS